ncbi:MAG TPA: hypothetical protein VKA48_06665, partial [Gammaproteobacteria bacterium]|nr:hypothetical protein [Gammaproteobacteria bacterium]
RRLGGRKFGSITFLCLGALQLTLSTLYPYIHLGLASEPIFRMAVPRQAGADGATSDPRPGTPS